MALHGGRKENSLFVFFFFLTVLAIYFTERGLTFHVTLENKKIFKDGIFSKVDFNWIHC